MKTRVLSALSVFVFAITMSAQWSAQNDIPAYHDAPAKKTAKLAPILKPTSLNVDGAALTEAQKKSYLDRGQDSRRPLPAAVLLPLRSPLRAR